MIFIIQKLLSFLDGASRASLLWLMVPMFFTAVLDMLSIGMIIPLSQVLLQGPKGDGYSVFGYEIIPANGDLQQSLLYIGLVFTALFILKNVSIIYMIYTVNSKILQMGANFQHRMFSIYLNQPYDFHIKRNSSILIRDLTMSISSAFEGLRIGLNIVLELFLVTAVCCLLLASEPIVTVVVSVSLLCMSFLFYRVLAPVARAWGEKLHNSNAIILKMINQGFGAIRDVTIMRCQKFLGDMFAAETKQYAHYLGLSITVMNIPRMFVETVVVVGFIIVIIVLLGFDTTVDEIIKIAGLFGMASLRIMPSMNRILAGATELKHRSASVETLFEDLQESIRRQESSRDTCVPAKPISFNDTVHIKGVSYTFDDTSSSKPAVRELNIGIKKGESIGIVGQSGAGKTTFINILMGLIDPQTGGVYVDGKNTSENISNWQSHFGYVPQSIYLLDDTVRRNIAFGLLDSEIDEERLNIVLKMSHLGDVVEGLPQNLDTQLGEHGMRLSGGQRQRIGIARALYRDPDIIVFDEATSALDNETEREVARAIEGLSGKKTLIIIAHRLSTVMKCDRLFFMKNGEIISQGSYDDLLRESPEFRSLAVGE